MGKKMGLTAFLLFLGLGAAALCVRGLQAVVTESGAARTWGGGVLLCGGLLLPGVWYVWDRVYRPLCDLEALAEHWPDLSAEERAAWTAGIRGAPGAAADAVQSRLAETQEELDRTRARLETVSETRIRRQFVEEICRAALPGTAPADDAAALAGIVRTDGQPACVFYDYFSPSADTLCAVVGEVPGGGIQEALCLLTARTLLRDCLRTGGPLTEALSDVNAQLYKRGGPHCLRSVVCLIDTAGGLLSCVSAGGEPPWLMRSEEQYEPVDQTVYPALGLNEQTAYRISELRLRQGDRVFLHTSGLGQSARTGGENRQDWELRSALNRSRDKNTPEEILCAAVSALADGSGADGVPMGFAALSLEYRRGSRGLAHRVVSGTPESAPVVLDFLKGQFEANGMEKRHGAKLAVLTEELFALYCRCGNGVPVTVECAVTPEADRVRIRMTAPLGGRDPLKWSGEPAAENAAAFIREQADSVTFQSADGRDTTGILCVLKGTGET